MCTSFLHLMAVDLRNRILLSTCLAPLSGLLVVSKLMLKV